MSHVAKLFTNGRSQAVRLPAVYRFEAKKVFIRRDSETGDVILSGKTSTWDDFLPRARAPRYRPIPWTRGNAIRECRIEYPLHLEMSVRV